MRPASAVLLTCGGKWVGMVCQIREAMAKVPELAGGRLLVADAGLLSPAGHFADQAFRVPMIDAPDYVDELLRICRIEQVKVLIPLVDLDLLRLASRREAFQSIGTTLLCPPAALAELAFDKGHFDAFAASKGIRVPRTIAASELERAPYPLFCKPCHGFGSIGACVVEEPSQAMRLMAKDPDLIFEERFTSQELSVDGLVSRSGRILFAVQRVRDKVIGGEAVRSHTVRLEPIRQAAEKVFTTLAELGFYGPANLQFFAEEAPPLFDVNLRLGAGGAVLSNMATGGRFFASMLMEACGTLVQDPVGDYELGLGMYKFLGDVFHDSQGRVRSAVPGNPDRPSDSISNT